MQIADTTPDAIDMELQRLLYVKQMILARLTLPPYSEMKIPNLSKLYLHSVALAADKLVPTLFRGASENVPIGDEEYPYIVGKNLIRNLNEG